MSLLDNEKNTSDIDLVKKVLAGEHHLYEVVVRRYNSYLYKVGRSYGYEHSDVEDLMQETYVNAYTHLKDFEGKGSLKPWLVQIMLHQCYHRRHKLSYRMEQIVAEDWEDENQSTFNRAAMDGNKTVQNKELKEILEEAVLRLPEDYRMVFSLRELTGHSTAETMELLHLSEANVKVRLNRAKKMLQNEIEKSYSLSELFEFHLLHCDGMVHRVMHAKKEMHP